MKVVCGWIYAIDRYGYPPNIEDTFRAVREIADMGFEYVELEGISIDGLNKKNIYQVNRVKEALKKECDECRLKVFDFLPVIPNLVSLDKVKRREALNQFDIAIEISRALDCKNIVTDSYAPAVKYTGESPYGKDIKFGVQFDIKVDPSFNWERQWDIMADSFIRCNNKAKKAGMNFWIEPRLGEMASNSDALIRLYYAVGETNFGIVLDVAHMLPQKENIILTVEKLNKRIRYVHISDCDGLNNEHRAIGKGIIDWKRFFMVLKKHNFSGDFAIDIGKVRNLRWEFVRAKKFVENQWLRA